MQVMEPKTSRLESTAYSDCGARLRASQNLEATDSRGTVRFSNAISYKYLTSVGAVAGRPIGDIGDQFHPLSFPS